MAFMEWKEEMSVGVPALDEQHRNLIRLINVLDEKEQTGETITYVFAELDRYVREHFRDEEAMLEKAGYADIEPHKAEHRGFEDWLKSVQAAYSSGGAAKYYIAGNVNTYLRGWLSNHILIIDMEYKGKLD